MDGVCICFPMVVRTHPTNLFVCCCRDIRLSQGLMYFIKYSRICVLYKIDKTRKLCYRTVTCFECIKQTTNKSYPKTIEEAFNHNI